MVHYILKRELYNRQTLKFDVRNFNFAIKKHSARNSGANLKSDKKNPFAKKIEYYCYSSFGTEKIKQ